MSKKFTKRSEVIKFLTNGCTNDLDVEILSNLSNPTLLKLVDNMQVEEETTNAEDADYAEDLDVEGIDTDYEEGEDVEIMDIATLCEKFPSHDRLPHLVLRLIRQILIEQGHH